MPEQSVPKVERPRFEPEIIPPDAEPRRGPQVEATVFAYRTTGSGQVKRLGPLGITLTLLAAGVLTVAGIGLLLGAALVGVVAAGVVITGAVVARLLRGGLR
jgi:hypothetical protein